MAKFFKRLFGLSKDGDNDSDFINPKEEGKDVAFVKNYKLSGGNLFYSDNDEDGISNLEKLLSTLKIEMVCCDDKELLKKVNKLNILTKNLKDGGLFALIPCESLIAFDGSILVSFDQINNLKVSSLPKSIIIWSYLDQIKNSSSEALSCLKNENENSIPTNITAIRGKLSNVFSTEESQKEIYLILVDSSND